VFRVLLGGHVGTACEDFAYVIGTSFDELLLRDIKIEISEVSSPAHLLDAVGHVEHDLVCLMFNPCINSGCVTAEGAAGPSNEGTARRARGRGAGAQTLPDGRDFIRVVRKRTLKPVFVIQNGALLRETSIGELVEAGADVVMSLPFSQNEFEAGLRRFLSNAAFKCSTAPVGGPVQLLRLPAPVHPRRFTAVSAVYAPSIQRTVCSCLRAVDETPDGATWVDIAAPTVDALLQEPALAEAGLLTVMLNGLEYPEDYIEVDRYMWLINELRVRTAAFIVTFNGHWCTPEALMAFESAGADLALPVPFDRDEVFEGVRDAYCIWASGR
jgi:hypothetical protein